MASIGHIVKCLTSAYQRTLIGVDRLFDSKRLRSHSHHNNQKTTAIIRTFIALPPLSPGLVPDYMTASSMRLSPGSIKSESCKRTLDKAMSELSKLDTHRSNYVDRWNHITTNAYLHEIGNSQKTTNSNSSGFSTCRYYCSLTPSQRNIRCPSPHFTQFFNAPRYQRWSLQTSILTLSQLQGITTGQNSSTRQHIHHFTFPPSPPKTFPTSSHT